MQELAITPSTLVFLGIILVLAALAVHRLVKRGACDCHDHCGYKFRRSDETAECACAAACCGTSSQRSDACPHCTKAARPHHTSI